MPNLEQPSSLQKPRGVWTPCPLHLSTWRALSQVPGQNERRTGTCACFLCSVPARGLHRLSITVGGGRAGMQMWLGGCPPQLDARGFPCPCPCPRCRCPPSCTPLSQGLILSPRLFNIYMQPLGKVIKIWGCGLINMQITPQLYLTVSSDPKEEMETLNHCLEKVTGWMKSNKAKLSPGGSVDWILFNSEKGLYAADAGWGCPHPRGFWL